MIHIVLLLGCAVAIYLACEWFVNAVEWLGLRLNVGTIAVGTVLAAVGTALPESVVTFVAVAFGGGADQKDIGVGAAMGGPLALSTIAYGVAGVMLWRMQVKTAGASPFASVDLGRLKRDQLWFLAIFIFKVGLGLVAFSIKPWLGIAFFLAYAVYFVKEMSAEGDHGDEDGLEPLLLQRKRANPQTWAVVVQTVLTLVVIFVASQVFVHQLEWAGPALGLSPAVVALLLSPIATELPEIMNAIIWIRQGKNQLALANISGAMMIQATVPSGIGIIFTPWHFDGSLLLSGLVTMAAIIYLIVCAFLKKLSARVLAASALFYGVFVVGLILIK